MLNFEMKAETGVLEVAETTISFKETRVRYWYYDTRRWLMSSHGKKGDIPERVMSQSDIDWVKKYYLPNVQVCAAI